MSDPTADFFEGLARRGVEPLLSNVTATVRFDVGNAGWVSRWLLTIDHGTVRVAPSDADADCVLAADRAVFDDIFSGRRNAMAALLRGELAATGRADLLVRLQRLFPGRPADAPPAALAGGWRVP